MTAFPTVGASAHIGPESYLDEAGAELLAQKPSPGNSPLTNTPGSARSRTARSWSVRRRYGTWP